MPFDYTGGHITLPVMLDGHLLWAALDTGASITTLSPWMRPDRSLRSRPGLAGQCVRRNRDGDNDPPVKINTHTLSLMTFEGVQVTHPVVMIVPVRLNGADSRRNFRRWRNRPPDLIIGMEVLRTLHIYIAFQERKLYITRADHERRRLLVAAGR